jgi:hypothetical protein
MCMYCCIFIIIFDNIIFIAIIVIIIIIIIILINTQTHTHTHTHIPTRARACVCVHTYMCDMQRMLTCPKLTSPNVWQCNQYLQERSRRVDPVINDVKMFFNMP